MNSSQPLQRDAWTTNLSPAEAAQHLLNRRRARRDIVEYASYIEVPGRPVSDDEDCTLFHPIESNLSFHHKVLLQALDEVTAIKSGRLMVLMPRGAAKSTYSSVVFPANYLSKGTNRNLILTSHGRDLAKRMGRRTRQILRQRRHHQVFNTELADDSQAAERFSLTNGSQYNAFGLYSGIVGTRAHGALIDDPVASRQDALSPIMRQRAWDAYNDDLLPCLIPGGFVILVMCMVGSTQVLMADGTYHSLKDIRVGDVIGTYDDGRLASTTVLRSINQGIDQVFAIYSRSGAKTLANSRHPFLVLRDGEIQWIRLSALKVGDMLVRLCTECTEARPVSNLDVPSLRDANVDACPIMGNGDGQSELDHLHPTQYPVEQRGLSTATESPLNSIKNYSTFKVACAQFVSSLPARIRALIGAASSVLTTITKRTLCAACSAMTVTLQLDTPRHQQSATLQPPISDFTLDQIIAIEPAGCEEVFDIQVERTENFIADGFVSHNTRWDEDDLAGRILPEDWNGESGYIKCRDGKTWRVLCVQAKCETNTDPIGRKMGEYLITQWFDKDHWTQYEHNRMNWESMFQQRPRPPEGAFFSRSSLLVGVHNRVTGEMDYLPVPMPKKIASVFAVIDTAIKTGTANDGTGVVYFGYNPHFGFRLTILDYDYQQIQGASLEKWLPTVFERCEELAKECCAFNGSIGAFIEDKGSGTILLQQAETHGWLARSIDSKLTSMGKVERAVNASPHVSAGSVKFSEPAYLKTVEYKGTTKNHLLAQLLKFSQGTVDKDPDDLLDCVCYGIAISCGNSDGF